MSLDSSAVFEKRLTELGVPELLAKFQELGWDSFGKFAFATDYVVGQGDPKRFDEEIVQPILGGERSKVHIIRRLFVESYHEAASFMARKSESRPRQAGKRSSPLHAIKHPWT